MKPTGNLERILDHLEVGISIASWHPEDLLKAEYIFVNDTRCRMSGQPREELVKNPPVQYFTRETRALVEKMFSVLREQGNFTFETILMHQSNEAIPVLAHVKLIQMDGQTVVMTEMHDIRNFKENESLLKLSRESMKEMLTLIDKEKQKISENIKNNMELVLYPLIDQMRITATGAQKEILDVMANRIGHIARNMGVVQHIDSFGLNLTKRQILICEMIRDGMTSKEIARALGCSPSTVNNHRNTIRRKLKLSGSATNLQAFLNSPVGGGS